MLESLSSSRAGMRMARGIGRALPGFAAGPIVSLVAGRMVADADSTVARASRSNQYVLSGGTLAGEDLERAANENVRYMARFLYDFYHVLGDRRAEDELVVRDDAWRAFLERERTEGPFVYSGVHLGNFDLVGRALGHDGWRMQILSVADPNAGYEWQNDVREEVGFHVTPVTAESLKQAARGLQAGQSVLTGHDRPLPRPDKVQPVFFGHPASMPLLHVRLAMRAKVPVVAMAAPRDADGRYRLLASDPIPMTGERADEAALLENARRCLAAIEPWIARTPTQWAMPHVVWPDVEIPA